jgi:glycosyltransferase involved in cell wall biosynthesis
MIVAVVPALDEEQSIEGVVAGALRYVDTVIVIDDGSTDATRDRALAAGARVVSHGRNRGVGAAIASGLAEAIAIGATVVVQIDGDGQHAVEFVADLVKEVLAGADLAVGNRFANEFEMGRARRFALRLFGWRCVCSVGSSPDASTSRSMIRPVASGRSASTLPPPCCRSSRPSTSPTRWRCSSSPPSATS